MERFLPNLNKERFQPYINILWYITKILSDITDTILQHAMNTPILVFIWKILTIMFRYGVSLSIVCDVIFVQLLTSLSLVTISGGGIGALISLQSYMILADKGMANLTGITVFKAMFYELGPLLNALIIIAKSGAASCYALAHMKQSNQLDAMITMGISPLRHLIIPTIIGNIILTPCLNFIHACSGVLCGILLSVYLFSANYHDFLQHISLNFNLYDLLIGILLKGFIFGSIISFANAFFGLLPAKGASGMSKNTSDFVFYSFSTVIITNFVIDLMVKLILYPYLWGSK